MLNTLDVTLRGTLTGHQNPIFAIENGFDEKTVFTAGNDKGIVEWDIEHFRFKRILCAVTSSVYALHKIPGTTHLAIALREGRILIVDAENQVLVKSIPLSKKPLFHILSDIPNNQLLVSGEEGKVFQLSLKDYALQQVLSLSEVTIRVAAVHEALDMVAFGDKNGILYLLRSSTMELIHQVAVHSMAITALAFVGDQLFSGARDAKLMVIDPFDGNVVQEIVPHMFTVYGIYPHPHLPIFATVSRDKSWKIWESDTLRLLKNVSRDKFFDSHHLSINAGKWLENENAFATISDDKSIRIWDVKEESL